MNRCEKFDKIDEIVSEYIANSDHNASDAMEDIIQVLDEQEPHYYNKIKERESSARSREAKRSEIIDMIYGGYDEEAIEKRDKVMEEFNNEYEVTHMDNEVIIEPKEDVEVNPWVDIFKKTGESQKNPLLPAEDMQKVMSLLYGKVDFNTFKTIERILGGEQ